jgi:hypothetical protein
VRQSLCPWHGRFKKFAPVTVRHQRRGAGISSRVHGFPRFAERTSGKRSGPALPGKCPVRYTDFAYQVRQSKKPLHCCCSGENLFASVLYVAEEHRNHTAVEPDIDQIRLLRIVRKLKHGAGRDGDKKRIVSVSLDSQCWRV